MSVPGVAPATVPLSATSHPLQRAGAWAVAVLAERRTPGEVTETDLDTVASRLVDDVSAAAVAAKDAPAYDWWKVLFALYPNSKATHSKRPRDRAVLTVAVAEMFIADDMHAPTRPCTFCGAPASAVWAKSTLPMFDTNKALNTLPPGVAGWPVCRGCRIAAWTLPYGAWVTAGSATVLSCEEEGAERSFVARNVRRAQQIMHLGLSGLHAGARAELVAVRAMRSLRAGLPAASTLWSFKNDNQELSALVVPREGHLHQPPAPPQLGIALHGGQESGYGTARPRYPQPRQQVAAEEPVADQVDAALVLAYGVDVVPGEVAGDADQPRSAPQHLGRDRAPEPVADQVLELGPVVHQPREVEQPLICCRAA